MYFNMDTKHFHKKALEEESLRSMYFNMDTKLPFSEIDTLNCLRSV